MFFCFVCFAESKKDRQIPWLWHKEASQVSRLRPRLSLVGLGKVNPIACHVQSGAVRRQDLAPPPSLEKTNLLPTPSRYLHLGEIVDMSNSFINKRMLSRGQIG